MKNSTASSDASTSSLTLNGEYTALFASMWQVVPTFHRYGRTKHRRDGDVSADYTACGLLVSSYDFTTTKLTTKLDWVPMRHALKFGKPCRKCFRDA